MSKNEIKTTKKARITMMSETCPGSYRSVQVTLNQSDTGQQVRLEQEGELEEALHTAVEDLLIWSLYRHSPYLCPSSDSCSAPAQLMLLFKSCSLFPLYLSLLDKLEASHAQLESDVIVNLESDKLVFPRPGRHWLCRWPLSFFLTH